MRGEATKRDQDSGNERKETSHPKTFRQNIHKKVRKITISCMANQWKTKIKSGKKGNCVHEKKEIVCTRQNAACLAVSTVASGLWRTGTGSTFYMQSVLLFKPP